MAEFRVLYMIFASCCARYMEPTPTIAAGFITGASPQSKAGQQVTQNGGKMSLWRLSWAFGPRLITDDRPGHRLPLYHEACQPITCS